MRGSAQHQLDGVAEGAAEDRAQRQRGREVAGDAAGADRQRRGDQLDHAQKSKTCTARPAAAEPGRAGDGELRRAVAAAEDAEPLPLLAGVVREDQQRRHAQDAEHEPADRGPRPRRHRQLLGHALHHAQDRQEEHGDDRDDHGQQAVERQVRGHERVVRRVREQRRLAEDRDHHRVGDDAGENAGDERVRLEVVAIEDLDGEERGAERGTEDGGQTGRDAGDEQDAPLALGDAEPLGDGGAERAADLHGRALATAGAAGAEREHRGHRLDPDDAPANDAAGVVKGVDHRVAAAAARLRRRGGDQARAEGADGGHDHEEPPAVVVPHLGRKHPLAVRAQRDVAAQILEEEPLHDLEAEEEGRTDDAGAEADQGGVQQGTAEDAQVDWRCGLQQRRQEPSISGGSHVAVFLHHAGRFCRPRSGSSQRGSWRCRSTSSAGCRRRGRIARMSAPPMTTMASGFCVSRADAVRERGRREAEHRHERRHQHRAQALLGGLARALLDGRAPRPAGAGSR